MAGVLGGKIKTNSGRRRRTSSRGDLRALDPENPGNSPFEDEEMPNENSSSSRRAHRPPRRVNHRGVIILATLTVMLIVLLQFIEEGSMQSGSSNQSPSATGRVYKFLQDAKKAAAAAGVGQRSERPLLERAEEAKNISAFVKVISEGEPVAVLTYVSYSYKSTLLNWLVAMERAKVRGVGVVCLDEDLRNYLRQRGIPCYVPAQAPSSSGDKKRGGQLNLKAINKLWIMRLVHLLEVLRSGVSVILSDGDAIWVDNAITSGLLHERTGDIVASRGKYPWDIAEAWGATLCMGVVYFRSIGPVITMLEHALEEAVQANDDQVGLNNALFNSFGHDPVRVFGRRLDVFEREIAVAPASATLPRLVILPNQVVPRFCNHLNDKDWSDSVSIAHCHALEGQKAKTFKNWGNAKNRHNIMSKYQLWCDAVEESTLSDSSGSSGNKRSGNTGADVDGLPSTPAAFQTWLENTAQTCEFMQFRQKHVNVNMKDGASGNLRASPSSSESSSSSSSSGEDGATNSQPSLDEYEGRQQEREERQSEKELAQASESEEGRDSEHFRKMESQDEP